METTLIKFYTSDTSIPEFLSFARLMGENLNKTVALLPLSALPKPDLMRPTRQQLRTERVDVRRHLESCKNMIALLASRPGLANQTANMRREAAGCEARLQEIDRLLGEQEGGEPRA